MPKKPSPATVDDYLAGLSAPQREALEQVRTVILNHLPEGYEECVQYGMIAYVVPHRLYPPGYHCNPKEPLPLAMLAAQKSYMALYSMVVYGDPALAAWLRKAFADAGRKLDMGKSCLRFKRVDDVPLEVIGQLFAKVPVTDYIRKVEATLSKPRPRSRPKPSKATPRSKKGGAGQGAGVRAKTRRITR